MENAVVKGVKEAVGAQGPVHFNVYVLFTPLAFMEELLHACKENTMVVYCAPATVAKTDTAPAFTGFTVGWRRFTSQ